MELATEPRLAILSVGRSGSGYIAAVLNAAGVPCGHEEWWNPLGEHQAGLAADSSWCALADMRRYPGAIGHQVRHPLATVASLTQTPDRDGYTAMRERILGELPGDPLLSAVTVTLGWNLECEKHTDLWWRVEDLDAEMVVALAALADIGVSLADARAAIDGVPTTTNDHDTTLTLGWGDLPDHPSSSALAAMAERYGYQ